MASRHGVDYHECKASGGTGLKGEIPEQQQQQGRGRGRNEGLRDIEYKKILAKERLSGPQFAIKHGRIREGKGEDWGERVWGEEWERVGKGEREGGGEVVMMLGGGLEVGRYCAGFVRGEGMLAGEVFFFFFFFLFLFLFLLLFLFLFLLLFLFLFLFLFLIFIFIFIFIFIYPPHNFFL